MAKLGIGYVPENQGIFADLTVEENMKVAMYKEDTATLERQQYVLELFPDLKKFWKRLAGIYQEGKSKCCPWQEPLSMIAN